MEKSNQPPVPTEVASELNNLLQIISGTSALLENIWEGKPDAVRYFKMMRESVDRAAEKTTSLLELSGSLRAQVASVPDFVPPPAKKKRANAAKQRIMVVDDEKMLLILTAEILRNGGYEVVTAQSGFECLDRFRKGGPKFDLVLLDLNMPLMDGEETFQRLRALQSDVRVALCTGYVQQERLNHMLAAGLCGFLQKPLGPKDYLARVRGFLAQATFQNCYLENTVALTP